MSTSDFSATRSHHRDNSGRGEQQIPRLRDRADPVTGSCRQFHPPAINASHVKPTSAAICLETVQIEITRAAQVIMMSKAMSSVRLNKL